VRGIPTVIVFKNGQAVDRSVGLVDKSFLQRMVEKYIRFPLSRVE
jgi:thioredoxin-like negative regulator of GroEL